MKSIARIRSDFPTKFGIPRQSGLVQALRSTVVFEPEFRNPDALRGLEGFDYIWLIWQFSASVREDWSPTVRPPRLGGNVRMGVFATRSPFRPNPIGLSSVRLEQIELHPELGPLLHVTGADLMDGTPILDIKPYVPYADSHPWPPAALPVPTAAPSWRSACRRNCSPGFPWISGRRCWAFCLTTPAHPTSRTQIGCMDWTSPASTSVFRCRTRF